MSTIRLLAFTSKPTPVAADIIYGGDSANSFSEVKMTAGSVINIYPALTSIGQLSTVANRMLYTTASNTYALSAVTTASLNLLSQSSNSTMLSTLGGVPLAGGTMTGLLILSGDPAVALGAATKQYADAIGTASLPLAGGTMLGNLILNADPTSALQAATKQYVDSAISNFSARLASTTALTVTYSNGTAGVGATLTNAGAQVALSLDGVAAVAGNTVLIKNQASTFQNGLYTVTNIGSGATNYVLTRATNYDTPAEIMAGDLVIIASGSTLSNTSWLQTATVTTIGTDPITFTQFSLALPILLSSGGTGASLTASNGGIFYSTASAGAILSGTSTAQQLLLSGASTTPQWSTTTYPLTNAINTLLYASSANVMAALATVNSAGLLTNGSGVPGWVAYTGTGAPVLATSPTLVTPILGAATATSLTFSSTSGIIGTTTNNSAAAGSVGEFISSVIVSGSAVSMASNAATDMTSISLTTGDWDVWGNITFTNGGTSPSGYFGWLSQTSATLADPSVRSGLNFSTVIGFAANTGFTVPSQRFLLSGTTTIYISGLVANVSGAGGACGGIYARRRR